ncbi:LOW QUALITY PROTEIN: peroxisomal membrane protein PEX14-like [Haliotis rubra]|uniref:LOW QUALITY PROTEIN: peroxisomal membrane protein PEX14-like n=1 Tax=Haliotis rubra TaxID=36100 RepID=UPI001EE50EBE|nr:LOW QUALITY PROTEIN: peroxisomal membrane protein PEX14-like [Haliotis rubra]
MADETGKVPDTVEVTKDVLAPADGPRENLISTAVKFLQNPKVQQSPLYQRKAFLEKKGLTKEEIDLAVQKAGVTDLVTPPAQPTQYPPGPFQQALAVQPPLQAPLPSTWVRVKDFTTTALIISSISYAVYRMYQLYIRPWLQGKSAQDDSRMDRLEQQLVELQNLNQNMVQVQETLKSIQESLTTQQTSLTAISNTGEGSHTAVKSKDTDLLQDVKTEISSLKGLLLSRRQFPPVPQTSPVLPSWQMSTSSTTLSSSDSSSSQSNGTETSSSNNMLGVACEEDVRLPGTQGDNSSSIQEQINSDSGRVLVSEVTSTDQSQMNGLEVKGDEPQSGNEPHSGNDNFSKTKDHSEEEAASQAISSS